VSAKLGYTQACQWVGQSGNLGVNTWHQNPVIPDSIGNPVVIVWH
jgi:hypothetical protein